MKILMLAPEPFFQPRGTPISVYFRIKALSDLGHEVDLITYPLGEDKNIKNLKIIRVPRPFFVNKIKIGPSLTKIPLDFMLLCTALWRLIKKRYDLVFSHEEASWFGTALGKLFRIPHIYDMHSSLPQQLKNFAFSRSRLIIGIFSWLEKFVLKNSAVVLVICTDLLNKVQKTGFASKAVLLENFLDFDSPEYSREEKDQTRSKYAQEDDKIVMYAGNFEPYQGISLLLEAAAQLKARPVVFLLVGGTALEVEKMRIQVNHLSISDKVHFVGQVSPSRVPLFISIADVLVSPRISGTNTPLKIYSYLKSGKPIVATDLWTHTQILNHKISILVEPNAENLAEGISYALTDKQAAAFAREFAEREFSVSRYAEKMTVALKKAQDWRKSPHS